MQNIANPLPVSGPLTDTQLRATPVPVVVSSGGGSIKANSGVSVTGSVNAGTVNLYTAPANGYAILNLSVLSGLVFVPDTYVAVSGKRIFTIPSGGVNPGTFIPQLSTSASISTPSITIYVGPGQTVTGNTGTLSGSTSFSLSGTEFLNT